MSDQFTASGYPKHAGGEPRPGRSSAQGAREVEQSPGVLMETTAGFCSSGSGTGQGKDRSSISAQLDSHGLCYCQFFWGESHLRGAAFHPEAARDFIHTPFAFPLSLDS